MTWGWVKAHIHSTSASESVRAKLCDRKCVKGQLLWYERGPELMHWVNTWRNWENKHRRGLFWAVHYRIHHAQTEFNQKLLARVPDVTLRGFQLFEGSFVRTILMVCTNNICDVCCTTWIHHLLTLNVQKHKSEGVNWDLVCTIKCLDLFHCEDIL